MKSRASGVVIISWTVRGYSLECTFATLMMHSHQHCGKWQKITWISCQTKRKIQSKPSQLRKGSGFRGDLYRWLRHRTPGADALPSVWKLQAERSRAKCSSQEMDGLQKKTGQLEWYW
nr:uncharacterized protein LOC110141686 isoform X2 [Odocoileus virginianus texanus]